MITSTPSVSVRRAQVARFVVITFALSFAFEAWMIKSAGGLDALNGFAVIILMWIPGLVSLALRFFGKEGFRDIGWRGGPKAPWIIAYAGPVLCAGLTYAAAVLLGIVHFDAPAKVLEAGGDPALAWVKSVGMNATAGVLLGTLFCFGEELGWRGYLVPRMAEANLPMPLVLSGLIWGTWHLPLIIWGDYSTSSQPLVSAALFLAVVTVAGVLFGRLRLSGGSLWPAVLAHSVHNVFYQKVFDRWFNGPQEPFFAGEQGLFSIAAYLLLLVLTARWLSTRPRPAVTSVATQAQLA